MSESRSPVTIKMIAKAAGVTHPTVSRALRNDSRNVSESTRQRIQGIARSMGYRPDPAMSALIAHRTRIRPHGQYGKLAILNAWGCPEKELQPFFRAQIKGMNEKADELGYQTEMFPVPEDATEQKRLSRILVARGIQGVIVAPLPVSRSSLQLDWEHFFLVSTGYSLVSPQLHFVASNHFQTIETVYAQLRQRGYKKIGFFHDSNSEKRNRYFYMASYLKSLVLDGISHDASPPLLPGFGKQPPLPDWLLRHGFDAVICGGSFEPQLLMDQVAEAGKRVPRDLGVAVFALSHERGNRFSGLLEDWHGIGRGAVSLLHSLMLSGKRGIPSHRTCTLIDGIWRPGNTLKARARKNADIAN